MGQLLSGNAVDGGAAGGVACPALVPRPDGQDLARWRAAVRDRVAGVLARFVRDRCAEYVHGVPGADFLAGLLTELVTGGKYVRSTFAYLGWLCGAAGSEAAIRAAASTELVHAFALLQDDVMDRSVLRRGRPAVHLRLADWHRAEGLGGSAERFGESAAILLGDLLLVWAERLLRDSGLGGPALARAWPCYDTLRGELAVGQFADLVNDTSRGPTLAEVLDVTRRKSGNYTVRRPLELGATLAGCDPATLRVLGRYGGLVGEAFQLRDDLLDVFGRPSVTGKPNGGDLRERKATSVVVLATELATPEQRARLAAVSGRDPLGEADVEEWRRLIAATGAATRIEEMIASRVTAACDGLAGAGLGEFASAALRDLAVRATGRVR